jgi:hypothetical protein
MNKIYQRYIVAGPGRTGSSLITTILSDTLGLKKIFRPKDTKQLSRWVAQTHNPRIQFTDQDVLVIKSTRDLLPTLISSCIASHYNEWTTYTSRVDSPFVIDLDDFENRFIWANRWHEAFDYYTKYTNTVTIDFESVTADFGYVFDAIGLARPEEIKTIINKSPRNQSNIANLTEVIECYNRLKQDPYLNTTPITSFKWASLDFKWV